MFEEERLHHYSTSLQCSAALPLQPPSSPARSQGLQLSTNDDALIGRADNGAAPCLLSSGNSNQGLHLAIVAVSLIIALISKSNEKLPCCQSIMLLQCSFLGSGGEHAPPLISAKIELAGYPHLVRAKPSSKQLVRWSLHVIWG